jgi:hypothetical protein|nr:MAG TPA: hypothetical protein [Caudoviricetes sp.]
MNLDELQAEIRDFSDHGLQELVREGAYKAQLKARDFVLRTHPATAFGGKNILYDNGHKEIRCGSFKAEAGGMTTSIYANYFARWFNTGAHGNIIRVKGKRFGQRGPRYPARGSYFEANAQAIQKFYSEELVKYVKTGGLFK